DVVVVVVTEVSRVEPLSLLLWHFLLTAVANGCCRWRLQLVLWQSLLLTMSSSTLSLESCCCRLLRRYSSRDTLFSQQQPVVVAVQLCVKPVPAEAFGCHVARIR
ncbi:unnamed protein product, partial [Ectocarpus sp. 8 AP-2014]